MKLFEKRFVEVRQIYKVLNEYRLSQTFKVGIVTTGSIEVVVAAAAASKDFFTIIADKSVDLHDDSIFRRSSDNTWFKVTSNGKNLQTALTNSNLSYQQASANTTIPLPEWENAIVDPDPAEPEPPPAPPAPPEPTPELPDPTAWRMYFTLYESNPYSSYEYSTYMTYQQLMTESEGKIYFDKLELEPLAEEQSLTAGAFIRRESNNAWYIVGEIVQAENGYSADITATEPPPVGSAYMGGLNEHNRKIRHYVAASKSPTKYSITPQYDAIQMFEDGKRLLYTKYDGYTYEGELGAEEFIVNVGDWFLDDGQGYRQVLEILPDRWGYHVFMVGDEFPTDTKVLNAYTLDVVPQYARSALFQTTATGQPSATAWNLLPVFIGVSEISGSNVYFYTDAGRIFYTDYSGAPKQVKLGTAFGRGVIIYNQPGDAFRKLTGNPSVAYPTGYNTQTISMATSNYTPTATELQGKTRRVNK